MKEDRVSRHSADKISPEQEVLLCCARAQIDPAATDKFCALASDGLNWDKVVANATEHRMSPVLHESITALGQDRIPEEAQQILSDAFRDSAANALGLVGELLRLYRLFDTAQIPVIPYKGPVLATLAYGNFSKRDYVDLDFAVPQQYIPRAIETLKAAGYRPCFDPQEAHAGQGAFAPGQYAFESGGRTIQVELHTERTLRYFPAPLDFQDLTRRLIDVEIAGQSLRTFSVEDTLVLLCVHGSKHFWDRLGWVFDIAKLITVQEVDWGQLQQIAARMKSTRVVLLGLYLAHDLFAASLPASVVQMACRDENVQILAQQVSERYAGASDPSSGVWSRAMFRIRSSDGIGQGVRHMLRLVLSPTESDRRIVRLPRSLGLLYAFVRPWRLVREYGVGAKRPRKADYSRGGQAS